jgi:protein gp37
MAGKSSIEWTEATWNPVTGCSKMSPGCKHCYANRMALRLQAIGQLNYRNGFEVTLHPHTLEIPLGWKKSRTIFVNSMSDLFHPEVPLSFIQEVFSTMARAGWHQFQVLTKRPERVKSLNQGLGWTENIWMGTSVESQDYVHRIDHLRETNAHIKFLSLEPLLGRLGKLDLRGIDWVIVGGESGPGARAMNSDWVREIRDHCRDQGVPFFSSNGEAYSKNALAGSWMTRPGTNFRSAVRSKVARSAGK